MDNLIKQNKMMRSIIFDELKRLLGFVFVVLLINFVCFDLLKCPTVYTLNKWMLNIKLDTSSGTTLQTTSYDTTKASGKTTSSEDDFYEASVDFLRQHLKRKSVIDVGNGTKGKRYSDTLLFDFDGNFKTKVKFLRLQNVEEFYRVLRLESCIPDRTLGQTEVLPAVKKQKSNISNLFKTRNNDSKTQSNNTFFNILRKLSPKNSKEDVKKKSEDTIDISSRSPTITSNSSFPSTIAPIPSDLLIESSNTDSKIQEKIDDTSSYIITNIWPPKNFKSTLAVIEESPRNSSITETEVKQSTVENAAEEDVTMDVTYKNNYCLQCSDSEMDLVGRVKRNSSKLSVCSEESEDVESDDEYTDWSTDSEEIDSDILSPSPVDSKLFAGDDICIPQEQIYTIVNNLIMQLKERNINCAFNNCNKDI